MKGGAAPVHYQTTDQATGQALSAASFDSWRQELIDRRQCLLRLAGGSLLALFPVAANATDSDSNPAADSAGDSGSGSDSGSGADSGPNPEQRWAIIGEVQRHMLPTEPTAPGATEINALPYLRRAMAAPDHDPTERQFILDGAGWLDAIARQHYTQSFQAIGTDTRERVMRRVAASQAGDNWLSTLLLYLLEALLTDPVYGGNPGGIGWQWLHHKPGLPRPDRPYYAMDFYRR